MERLYVLTRTSGRPGYFARCRESVQALSWPGGVTHIVHSDDPRNEQYIDCDILVRGEAHGPYMGSAPYNLYNNRLIEALPGDGWVHFIDDDDEYPEPDVFERLLAKPNKSKLHVGRVKRGGGTIWPKYWGRQVSFQTESFCIWSDLAKRGKWWADKGGDHYYSKQLTRKHGIVWVDGVIIAQTQNGKNNGVLHDVDGTTINYEAIKPSDKVLFKLFVDRKGKRAAKVTEMVYSEARVFERHGYGRVTYQGVEVCNFTDLAKAQKTA